MKKTFTQSIALPILMTLTVFASGCGKDDFVKTQFSDADAAAGFRAVPAKVDIVIMTDNSASMTTAITNVESQMSGFISSIRGKYWDYRVAKLQIMNSQSIQNVLVNPDFNSATLPDGTPNPSTNLVDASHAINDVGNFLPLVPSLMNGYNTDETYSVLTDKISSANSSPVIGFTLGGGGVKNTGITTGGVLRRDALLAVIVLTNGAEYSVDPNANNIINTAQLNSWANQLKALRNAPSLVRFYPVAAYSATANGCYGNSALIGTSYTRMITDGLLQGKQFNICDSSSLSNVLSSIEADLEVVRQAYIHEYLVIANQPIPETIKVYKNGIEVPQNPTNGWSYLGGPQTVYTITGIQAANGSVTPFNADAQTGYVIKLNGTAKMIGNDFPTITYQKP